MKENIKIYKDTIDDNISDIKKIFNDLNISFPLVPLCENTFNQTSSFITSKWEQGRKYSRTLFIQKALQDKYSNHYLQLSLLIDSMVNILDDLLDEDLDKKTKEVYMIEFSRVFSNFNKIITQKTGKLVSSYVNKLIVLAVSEKFFEEEIKKSKKNETITKKSAELLILRAMDLDIFLQLGVSDLKLKKILTNRIQEISRFFRAMNILKKDIYDIDHDKKNKIQTITTIVLSKRNIIFKNYIKDLIARIDNFQKEKISSFLKDFNKEKECLFIIDNFRKMLLEDKKKILKIIDNI